MSIQLKGSDDSVFTSDVLAPNIPTIPGGQFAGYQQGLWTPTASAGTIETAQGRWWRIGNNVTIQGQVVKLSDRSSAAINVAGIPYASIDFSAQVGYVGSVMAQFSSGSRTIAYLNTASERVQFYASSETVGGNWSGAAYNQLGTNNEFRFQLSYLTDDTTFVPINGATIS